MIKLNYFQRANSVNLSLIAMSVLVIGMVNIAYADPLDDIVTTVNSLDGIATIEINWNNDDTISYYDVGCVTCIPNYSENTTLNHIVLNNVTLLSDGSALLYVIAYDNDDNITAAKQILVNAN